MVEDSFQAENNLSYLTHTKASIFCAQFHTIFECLQPDQLDFEEQKGLEIAAIF